MFVRSSTFKKNTQSPLPDTSWMDAFSMKKADTGELLHGFSPLMRKNSVMPSSK